MPVTFQKTRLDNGLTILAELNDDAHTSAVGFFVNVGTRDETPDIMGVSHFLEHMMFKGTARRSADDVNREFDQIGADYNASTSQETTLYYAHVLPEFMPRAIDLLGDMLRPALRDADFQTERQVILEEIGMYADRPFWVAYENAMERFYNGHPLGFRILGPHEVISQLPVEQMRDYFNQRYSPDNMVVALAGRIDFDAAVEQIRQQCGGWKPTGIHRRYIDPSLRFVEHVHADAKLKQHYVALLAPGPARQGDDRYAAAVLSQVIGDSDGSRLYWALTDPGLAEEVEFTHQPFDRAGSFMAYVSCAPDNAAKVEGILFDVLDRAGDEMNDGEVERARNKIATELMLQGERPAGRMMGLGGSWLATGDYRPLEEELARVMAVDAGVLRNLVARYPLNRRTIVRCTPTVSGAVSGAVPGAREK